MLDSPLAFWELQDAGDYPQDSSGNGHHMDTKVVKTGFSYRNIGTGGSVGIMSAYFVAYNVAYVGINSPIMTAVDDLTLEIWSGGISSSVTLPFFGCTPQAFFDASTVGGGGYGIETANNNWMGGIVLTPTSFHQFGFSSATLLTGGRWNHLVMVRRAGVWELWINKVLKYSGDTTTPPTPIGGVWVGNGDNTSGRVGSGNLAYAALYTSPLTSTRIAAHYDAMHTWPDAIVQGDEHPTDEYAGSFTTTDALQGLVPDRPPHDADYNELSWMGTGSADIEYATGDGTSIR